MISGFSPKKNLCFFIALLLATVYTPPIATELIQSGTTVVSPNRAIADQLPFFSY